MEYTSPIRFSIFVATTCCLWTIVRSQSLKVTLGPLAEEQKSGTLVGNIARATPISSEVSQAEFSTLKFGFLDATNPKTHLFNINARSGAILTQTKIDRESICEDMDVCLVEFDVTVTSDVTDYLRLVAVTINITDTNDNMPSFRNDEIVINVPENNAAGLSKPLPTAEDKDTRENSVQGYRLMRNNGPFTLNVERRLNNKFSVDLVITRQLDREVRDHYTVLLLAHDGGPQPMTGTLTVHVNVTDVNDFEPEFSQQDYSFSVVETAGIGDVVGKVTATDRDIGRNKDIRYLLVFPARDHRGPKLFGIDQYTGEITIKTPLQYDAGKTFQAVVEARDQGIIQNLAESTLTLTVVNVGNNAPRLDLKLTNTVREATVIISEGAKKNTFVGKLSAIDNDPGSSGVVSCWSRHPSFKVDDYGDYFTIILNGTLDREEEGNVDVTLVCRDKGRPPKEVAVTFYVIVSDVNDNPPKFSKRVYEVNVTEENSIGKPIIRLTATDADSGINKAFSYSLFPKENRVFAIHEDTGVLKAITRLDHETVRKYNVLVLASDKGIPSLVSTATVIVSIKDINDNYPVILTKELRVPEGGGMMKRVGYLKGSDDDDGTNAELLFSMPPSSGVSGEVFRVNSDGSVIAIQELDREKRDRYHLNVEVRDRGFEPKMHASTVTVIVEDINDNAPVFHYPTTKNQTITLMWHFGKKKEITRMNASDADLGENRTLSYYIRSGNKAALFGLDKDAGVLYLNRRVRASDDQVHHLVIAAHDWGVPEQETTADLEVMIDVTNATFAALEGKRVEDKYILIAGIVAGITFLFSIIILVIIFVIRNGNRRRPLPPMADKHQNWQVVKMGVQEECGKGEVVSRVGVAWRGSNEDIDKKEGGSERGKDSFSHGSQPDVTKTGSEISFKKALASNATWSDGRDGYIQTHSNVGIGLDPYRKQEFYTFCKVRNPHDDVHSVTSGETTNSDSGRGGSEDDIPLPPIAECSPELNSNHGSPKHVTEYRPITTLPSNSMLRHQPTKNEYKTLPSLTSFKGIESNLNPMSHALQDETSLGGSNTLPYINDKIHPSSRYNNLGYTSLTQVSSKPSGGPGRHVTFSNRGGGGSSPFNRGSSEILSADSTFSKRSPVPPPSYDSLATELNSLYVSLPRSVDDDDGNTTTSGSYTLDSDNLNESIISA